MATGWEVRARIAFLQAQLTAAQSVATALATAAALPSPGPPPDPDAVRAAVARQQDAARSVGTLQSRLSGPEAEFAAAQRLALQATALREAGDTTTARALGDASDAGIPPDSMWHKLGDLCAKAWKGLIEVAKVVVVVGGIIALVIGGPIAWVVFAAALLVLADTLVKYGRGDASLWEVGLAALACIPMTKGLTSLSALKGAAAEGSLLAHLGQSATAAVKPLMNAAETVWRGRSALPGLARALPYTAAGKLTTMATELRYGAAGWRRCTPG